MTGSSDVFRGVERRLLPTTGFGPAWLLVAAGLAVVFGCVNYLSRLLPSPDLNVYLVQPCLWLTLAALSAWAWRQQEGDWPAAISERAIVVAAALLGLAQVICLLLAGMLAGFGYSPYARQPLGVVLNVWFVGSRLLGMEVVRWYLVRTLGKRAPWLGLAVSWLVLTIMAIPLAGISQLGETGSAFRYSGRLLLPVASESLLASYLALAGGPLAAIAYRGLLAGFEWLSPILPDLRWTFSAFIGTLVPMLGLLAAHDVVARRSVGRGIVAEETPSSGIGWVLVAVLAVFLFWFNTGLFGVSPSLISGISMLPNMKAGDIAITREVAAEEIEVGDVIRFRDGHSSILHRVIEVRQGEGGLMFITQGDNNNVADPPVAPVQLEGKLVVLVPEVGWVPIYVGQLFRPLLGMR